MKQKAFYQILQDIRLTPQKSSKYLLDKRLTDIERKIIEAHLLIRKNENEKVLTLLQDKKKSDINFIESQRLLALGLASINLSRFIEARDYLEESITLIKTCDAPSSLASALFNLFLVYFCISDLEKMNSIIKDLEERPSDTIIEKIRILRCKFMYHVALKDNLTCKNILTKIGPYKQQMVESDLSSHLVTEFYFFIQIEDFKSAYKTIHQLRNQRTFYLSENFKFMKTLLDNLTKNSPIYAYDKDFISTPLLLYQIKVIQALEVNDLTSADIYWKKLQQIVPGVYSENFQYLGQKCLFSLCLDKHRPSERTINLLPIDSGSKIEKLYAILQEADRPLSKEVIYELIWDEPIQNKSDLSKLVQLVAALRTRRNIEVISKKGTYSLAPALLKKKNSA